MSIYYRGAAVALLCSPEADHSAVEEWFQAVKSVTPMCQIIPVLTKSDLFSEDEILVMVNTFE
jgi:GTPase SAR1 family protein